MLRLKFSDGIEGEIDFRDELDGFVFDSFKNLVAFNHFRIDPDLHALV
jgi:hypothetical protein